MEKNSVSEVLQILEKNFKENRDNRIKQFDEYINKTYDLDYSDNLAKEAQENKIEPDKMKMRKFKIKIVTLSIITLAIGGTITVLTKKPWLSEKEKFIEQMALEAEIHGGKKSTIDDKYIYDLEAHEQSGDCLIQGDGFVRDRMIDACIKHELSDEVTKEIVEKFELNYQNKYKEADRINPLKTYQKEQKEQKNDNSYGM